MTGLSPTCRRRLAIQGFTVVDEDWLAEVSVWLRFSPALCAVVAAIGTAAAAAPILYALAATALLGAVLPFHPFDLIYNYGIRFFLQKRPLPPNGAPRRFACAVAAVWLVVTALLLSAGQLLAGYTLGVLFVAVATLVSTTDICVPSLIYHFSRRIVGAAPETHTP